MPLPLTFLNESYACPPTLLFLIFTFTIFLHVTIDTLWSGLATAAASGTATVYRIIAGESTQSIWSYQNSNNLSLAICVRPNTSFEFIPGGYNFFCGLMYSGLSILWWGTALNVSDSGFNPRRIYNSPRFRMTDLAVRDDQVCAREVSKGVVRCWRGERGRSLFLPWRSDLEFSNMTSGSWFGCGILASNSKVSCLGANAGAGEKQKQFSNLTMSTLVARFSNVCGLTISGELLICKGKDELHQPSVPPGYSEIAVGANSAMQFVGGMDRLFAGEETQGDRLRWGMHRRKCWWQNQILSAGWLALT